MSSDPVFTLRDLATWPSTGASLAVLGFPIKHSLSPAMHNAALRAMAASDARFADWRYSKFEVDPQELPAALKLFHDRGFRGLNLTVPHKIIAFGCVATVDPAARPIGAVNTLRRTAAGWEGFNTDGHGLAAGIRETLGLEISGRPVILLGAGGAARGAAVECLQRRCASLHIANRTRANLDALLAALYPLSGDIPVRGFDPAAPPADLPPGALVVNATSAGLKATDALPIELARLPRPAGVYDMIYNPPETGLLRDAVARGVPAANGLTMLVHQGARALEIWTGTPPPVGVMQAAARAALA